MRLGILLCTMLLALTGCNLGQSPVSYSVSYPDTSIDISTSARVIPAGNSSFEIQIEFAEAVTGFEQSDIKLTGGTISSFTTNSDDTVFTIVVDVDLSAQPGEISYEFTGTIGAAFGNTWSPNISGTFTFPISDFTIADRQNGMASDWGAARASSSTHVAVVYSDDYATTLANGVIKSAIEMTSSDMELVQTTLPNGVSSYRGVIRIGDEDYSAEMHITPSGSLGLRIFDPSDIIITRGREYTGSLTGAYTYTGALSATEYSETGTAHIQGDFSLVADFAADSFTINTGVSTADHFSIIGAGVLDSSTGAIASDTVALYSGDQTNIAGITPITLVTFGNIHGDGTDVSGVFYSGDASDLHYLNATGQVVGSLVGSQ